MLGEYKVSRSTRRCFTLDRPLKEGEVYYSVVIETDEELLRRDFSAESWQGPPDEAVGWWKNRMPTTEKQKLVLAPPAVLLDVLNRLADHPDKAKGRYLLALMLLRRRLLRETKKTETNEPSGPPTLNVETVADGTAITIPIVSVSRSEIETLTDELNSLLYCESEPNVEEESN